MLKSADFLVFNNFNVCGKYDKKVQIETIDNNTFPNTLYTTLNKTIKGASQIRTDE